MDWSDSPEQAAFRRQVRTFIDDHLPELYKRRAREKTPGQGGPMQWQADRVSEDTEEREAAEAWRAAVTSRGWVAAAWPEEYGGAGLTAMEQFIYNQEMARASAPMVSGPNAVWMLGPTLIVHGTEEQRQRVLPGILQGTKVWAQGYSEPEAGSDLASLQTRAVRDGDDYVITGQKIWTSGAHNADAIFILARTDPDAAKHRGISFLMIEDIHTPGITVRPLVNAAWGHEFNEVFFDEVRTPKSNLVGEENRGWYVGMTLLDFERSGIAGMVGHKSALNELLQATRTDERVQLKRNPILRHRIAEAAAAAEVAESMALRVASIQAAGGVPNYEASMAKVFHGDIGGQFGTVRFGTFGLYSNLWDPDEKYTPLGGRPAHGVIGCSAGGGSPEIQRNVIATRGLGLPRG